MKVSEITKETILITLGKMRMNLEDEDISLIGSYAKRHLLNFCKSQTGLTQDKLDEHEDLTIAVLTLISDMWDNRSMTIQKGNINIVVDAILGMHRTNLVPTPDSEVV